jgi:hypothetical protein
VLIAAKAALADENVDFSLPGADSEAARKTEVKRRAMDLKPKR